MNHIAQLQRKLSEVGTNAVVVPSSDEYISEFAPPNNRRLEWVTGFSGSTGVALVTRSRAALFLDGRYQLQGAAETRGSKVEICPFGFASRIAWMRAAIGVGGRISVDPWLHSEYDLQQWRAAVTRAGASLDLQANLVDAMWSKRPRPNVLSIEHYPEQCAGASSREKLEALVDYLDEEDLDGLFIADPEDVSWVLNVRAGDEAFHARAGEWHTVPYVPSRLFLPRTGRATWFVEEMASAELVADADQITVSSLIELEDFLTQEAKGSRIGSDLFRLPSALASIIGDAGTLLPDNIVARSRWRKDEREVAAAKKVHVIDAAAVIRFLAWLDRTLLERTVDEFEAAEKLTALRAAHPDFKGVSEPPMSASGLSGAQPHYFPVRHNARIINEHPIYWMDSGGQYLGGTTDNTVTLAVGAPEPKHIQAHTLVLKGFLAMAMAKIPIGTYATNLHAIARTPLWQFGMDYKHGTGHGVGNLLNIHEGPFLNPEPGPLTTVPLVPGMIITNEPGYYAAGDFGLRIESHMVARPSSECSDFLEFDTISRLPIDPNLIDFERLNFDERVWLNKYHKLIVEEVSPLLDARERSWLAGLAGRYEKSYAQFGCRGQ